MKPYELMRLFSGGHAWSPAALFSGGKLGAWYDITDTSTLFQDSAGTTPVTATGQPIGKIVDKSPNAAHATQATATARPVIPSAGYRLRSDFVDDFISATLGADCEVWINTPYGCQRGRCISDFRLPLCDVTQVVAVQGTLTGTERDAIKAYFGTTEALLLWMVSNADLYRTRIVGVTVDVVFTGANGATKTLTYTGGAEHNEDLTTYGLTAPVMAVIPGSLIGDTSMSQTSFYGLGAYGIASALMPTFGGNTGLSNIRFDSMTGGVGAFGDISGLTALTSVQCQSNQIAIASDFAVSSALGSANISNNALSQAQVDKILSAFVAAGRTSASGTCSLNIGGTNAAPSATGAADKATLVSRGWSVYTS